MLKYKDIADLPQEHPLYQEFLRELEREASYPPDALLILDDEESLAYFDRYIAGDR